MKNFKRVLSLALAALMVIGGLVVAPVDAKAETTYTKVTSVSELTEGTKFVIVASLNGKNYVPGAKDSSSKGYVPVEVSLDNLSSATVFEVVSISSGKYVLKSAEGYLKTAKNAFSFSASAPAANWEISNDATGLFQFKDSASTGTTYFINLNGQGNDNSPTGFIRCYTDKSNDSKYAQKWSVYKVNDGTSGGTAPETPVEPEVPAEPELGTIADALAAANNTVCKVKGVVTLVDGQNIYLQDSTGGICVRMGSAPSDIKLGDTIEAQGSKTVYKGLPQLGSGTYTKSTGLTLAPKTTTIDALTTADICTYVKLTGLTVTVLDDNNGQYDIPNVTLSDGTNTIQLYKPALEKVDGVLQIAVGDKIDIVAAVGVFNTTLQLRNTLATEITKVVVEEPDDSEDPSESESESESQAPSESESEKEELTAKDILAEAAKLEDGQYLGGSKDVKYTLKGVITKYEFNEQYGDASITIKVDGTDETFYCYQVKGEDVKNLKVGDRIELNGAIKNYKGTIEFERPNLVAILPTGDFSSVGTVMILIAGVACLAVAFTSKKKMA